MNFRDALIDSGKLSEPAPDQHTAELFAAALRTTPESHPRVWKRLESRAKRIYKSETGIAIKAGFDWATIKQWLADHWLQIVGILVSIILMFL